MNFKSLTFPRGKTPGLFPAMLNEQAALGWEYVELYASNPNRPQHLSVLFKSDAEPEAVAEPEPVKEPEAPKAPAEPEAPATEEAPAAPAPEAPAKPAAKSKPGARRGRKPAVKKA